MRRQATIAIAAGLALAGCAADEAPAPEHPRHAASHLAAHHARGAIEGVRCGVVWDPVRGAIEDGRIVFDGERISAMGPASSTPGADEELDLRPLFCMPGLVDAHTHLTSYARQKGTDDMDKRRTEADTQRCPTLRAGVTSVRDLGGEEGVDLWLRARIATGALPGPRMQCAGSQIGADGPPGGPAGAKASVDAHAEAGFDVIKLFATGGAHDPVSLMTAPEIAAATDEAHAHGLRVAVHAITHEGIERSIAAHVDSIEHAQELTVEQAAAMAAAGITLVPTLYILRYYVEDAEDLEFTPRPGRAAAPGRHPGRPLRAPFPGHPRHRGEGRHGLGRVHGAPRKERARALVHGQGRHDPEQALRAATATSAALMGWEGKVGTLTPGAFADVVALKGDPRKSIDAVEHPSLVIKGGEVERDDRH